VTTGDGLTAGEGDTVTDAVAIGGEEGGAGVGELVLEDGRPVAAGVGSAELVEPPEAVDAAGVLGLVLGTAGLVDGVEGVAPDGVDDPPPHAAITSTMTAPRPPTRRRIHRAYRRWPECALSGAIRPTGCVPGHRRAASCR
jgi:hypothetical protein